MRHTIPQVVEPQTTWECQLLPFFRIKKGYGKRGPSPTGSKRKWNTYSSPGSCTLGKFHKGYRSISTDQRMSIGFQRDDLRRTCRAAGSDLQTKGARRIDKLYQNGKTSKGSIGFVVVKDGFRKAFGYCTRNPGFCGWVMVLWG